MKCFYHIDCDGKCSAFWVKELAKHYDNYETEFIPINYGMNFPFDSIRENALDDHSPKYCSQRVFPMSPCRSIVMMVKRCRNNGIKIDMVF
jgi:hypothetical protein